MTTETAYQETLDYLYRFVDYSLTHASKLAQANFDLQRMHDFMAHLGHPERSYPIIHVAGTKGKGSVSALIANALSAAGLRTALYTSPHLHDYNERIQIDGRPIAHTELIELVDELRPDLDGAFSHLTTFEITTALALLYFARQGAQAVVLEVGLGGRLDATNIIDPKVSVITSLSLDHTLILGNTIEKIATEKAGIIKPGAPVVLAPQQEPARLTVSEIAVGRQAPLIQVGRDILFEPLSHSLDGQSLRIWPAPGLDPSLSALPPVTVEIPLLGAHQLENAAVAYGALSAWKAAGLPIDENSLRAGFASVHWPGRFEILRRNPPVVLDSAHNRHSARLLRQAVADYFPGYPVVLLFGASEDKDVSGILSELLPHVQQAVLTRSFHPRAMPLEQLTALVQESGTPAVAFSDVSEALPEALRLAGDRALVLVTGSIFICAGARETWDRIQISSATKR
jgi:dihydrofolate synthase/folylpolyglutamate synthase